MWTKKLQDIVIQYHFMVKKKNPEKNDLNETLFPLSFFLEP